MASSATQPRLRKSQDPHSNSSQGDSESREDGSLMRGLLSCIAGVGGVSIALWLLFFVFLEPYDPDKQFCTLVNDPSQLTEAVTAFEFVGFDWREYGLELGLNTEHLDAIPHDEGEDCQKEIGSVLRLWYETQRRACWESAVKALVRMDETKSAKQLAKKYHVTVNAGLE